MKTRFCKHCTAYQTERIPKLSEGHTHDYSGKEEIVKQPSCTKCGTKVKKCTQCGKIIESESIDMVPHTMVDTVTEPTPTSQGYTTHRCSKCGYSYVDTYVDYVAPHVHDFSGKEVIVKNASCTEEGSKEVYCTGEDCEEYTVVSIPKTEHTPGDWEITEAASCTKCGTKVKKCTQCHTVVERQTIPMTDHELEDTVVPATPDAQGYTHHKCKHCSYSYKDNFVDYIPETIAKITVDTKKSRAGQSVFVNVTLENNPGIWGIDLVVNYDKTKLTLSSVTNGTVFSDSEWTKGNLSGEKYILSYESGEFENITANGVIATLEFTVNETANVDDFYDISVSFNPGDIIDVSFNEPSVEIVPGGIQVIKFIYGDLNGDGLINKKDSLLMKMYLADNSTVIDKDAANVFVDDSINKKDSLLLKQYLAGLNVKLGS